MNLSSRLDTLIYFLMYCVALGLFATLAASIESFLKFITARKLLRIKRLESKH